MTSKSSLFEQPRIGFALIWFPRPDEQDALGEPVQLEKLTARIAKIASNYTQNPEAYSKAIIRAAGGETGLIQFMFSLIEDALMDLEVIGDDGDHSDQQDDVETEIEETAESAQLDSDEGEDGDES